MKFQIIPEENITEMTQVVEKQLNKTILRKNLKKLEEIKTTTQQVEKRLLWTTGRVVLTSKTNTSAEITHQRQ